MDLVRDTAAQLNDPTYFICGPSEFGKYFKEELLKSGIPVHKVKLESWG